MRKGEFNLMPFGEKLLYWSDDSSSIYAPYPECALLAYKSLEASDVRPDKAMKDTSRPTVQPMHEKLRIRESDYNEALKESFPQSIESKIISEKMGFKELAPIGSGEEWKGRELEVYYELRDSHLELIRENMEKDKEIELLKQRIKDIHRCINDAKAALDV